MRTQTGKMPLWLRIALVFVVLVIIGLVGLVFFLNNLFIRDPAKVQVVLQSIVKLKQPLSDSFKYQMAMDVQGVKLVTIQHAPEGLELAIGLAPVKGDADPQKMVDKISASMGKGAHKFTEQRKGEEDVAGKKLEYVIGKVESDSGVARASMIGYFPPDSQGRTVFIYGLSTQDGDYDMKTTDEFLQDIDSLL